MLQFIQKPWVFYNLSIFVIGGIVQAIPQEGKEKATPHSSKALQGCGCTSYIIKMKCSYLKGT